MSNTSMEHYKTCNLEKFTDRKIEILARIKYLKRELGLSHSKIATMVDRSDTSIQGYSAYVIPRIEKREQPEVYEKFTNFYTKVIDEYADKLIEHKAEVEKRKNKKYLSSSSGFYKEVPLETLTEEKITILAKIKFYKNNLHLNTKDMSKLLFVSTTTIYCLRSILLPRVEQKENEEVYNRLMEHYNKILEENLKSIKPVTSLNHDKLDKEPLICDLEIPKINLEKNSYDEILKKKIAVCKLNNEINEYIKSNLDMFVEETFNKIMRIGTKIEEVFDTIPMKEFKTKQYNEHFCYTKSMCKLTAKNLEVLFRSIQAVIITMDEKDVTETAKSLMEETIKCFNDFNNLMSYIEGENHE